MFPDEWTNPFHRLCVMVLASHGSSFTFMLLGGVSRRSISFPDGQVSLTPLQCSPDSANRTVTPDLCHHCLAMPF